MEGILDTDRIQLLIWLLNVDLEHWKTRLEIDIRNAGVPVTAWADIYQERQGVPRQT